MGFFVDRIVPGFVWMFAVGAMMVGMAFTLSKTLPSMPNKVSRFFCFFVLSVPFGIGYGYSKVWLLGSSKMSLTEALILALPGALLSAIVFTLCSPLSQNSNSQ